MKRSHLLLVALATAAAAAGCDTGFDPQYRVTDLRILGVRAAIPTARPSDPTRADLRLGDTVRLSALVANPQRRGPVTVSFYGCLSADLDAFTACVDEEILKDPRRLAELAGQPGSGVFLLGRVVKPAPPAGAPKADETVIDFRVPAFPNAFDPLLQRASAQPTYRCSLFAEVPIVVFVEAQGILEVALKRVRAVPSAADFARFPALDPADYEVNENPVVVEVTRASLDSGCQRAVALPPPTGADAAFPTGRLLLCGVPDRGQEFKVCDENGPAATDSESRSWQWFVDAGEFPEFTGIGNAVDASPEFERPPGAFSLWVVLRDGRGGVDWTRRDVTATR